MLCLFVYRSYGNGVTNSGHVGSNGITFRRLWTGNTWKGATVATFKVHL